jgi:hypothetical protein
MNGKWLLLLLLFLFQTGGYAQSLHSGSIASADSVTVAASTLYKNPSFFKRFFLGTNYRTVWATPVTLPVFNLRQSGLKIKEMGGGQQTKSLRLLDKSGHEWALRTIDKDVEKALPPRLQNTLAEKVVQDMVSAAHPYAPLTIPTLAKAAGVIAASPVFYFVPDDPAFDTLRNLFKNTVCMLEDREPTPDNSPTKNTAELVTALLQNRTTQLNEPAILRARLLDMLIGDWDRHQDQWRWGFEKVDKTSSYYAIPRDRDQAYFHSKGVLVKLARALAAKHLVGFANTTSKLKKLNAKSWNFDRLFLSGLDAKHWNNHIQEFTRAVNDSIIHTAVKKMPPEVYPLYGPKIERKLIRRRNGLQKDAMRYYRFLASDVVVNGTAASDHFVIRRTRDSVTVQQFAGADASQLLYSRTFYRRETFRVTLVGLDGADTFTDSSTGTSRINVVIDGGTGANRYLVKPGRNLRFFDSPLDAKAYLLILKKQLRIKE